MNKEDIRQYPCVVSDSLVIKESSDDSIPSEEQECIMNISRIEDKISVDCSHQSYILKLMKSEQFTLESMLVSTNHRTTGYVLQIKGTLEENSLTIRRKKKVLNEEQKKELRERLQSGKHT